MQPTVWRKPIPRRRDRRQSNALLGAVTPLLLLAAALGPIQTVQSGLSLRPLLIPVLLSTAFAAVVWLLRSATPPAAFLGLLVCMILAQSPTLATAAPPHPIFRPAIPALIALFLLTFLSTRYGRAQKEKRGLAEPRHGRRASQIVANLGVAALCAAIGQYAACIAALAEATADTVSSEIGQAVGGPAFLITTFGRVPPGTDGGISLAGTLAGVAAAAIVVAAGSLHHLFSHESAIILAAATIGLFFDSLLGATIERRGWIGNDLVNFSSTLVVAAIPILWRHL